MPRTSRSVAQRLATQTKSKKRRSPRTGTPSPESSVPASEASGPSIGQILDEVMPSEAGAGARAASTPTLAPKATAPTPNRPLAPGGAAVRRATAGRATAKPAPTRRRYHEYAADYSYVSADLRRILIVAGVLIALLVILSFVLPY
jgi:hypothetical protein